MGICCQAKEVISANNICDVPVYMDENKQNNVQNNNDNTNNNSANNDNNNTVNKPINNPNNNLKNSTNNQASKETAQKPTDPPVKEGKRKSILKIDESKAMIKKQSSDMEENEDEEKKGKLKGKKKVAFFSKNDLNTVVMNTDENNTNNKKRKRGHSIISQNKISKFTISENEENKSNKENPSKFQRNKKKAVTLIDKNLKLSTKLRGVEMKIPVVQETLITQKFGDPDKYYKKIKDLGSGSYGSVYQAKNIVMDNIVAIKVIEKVQDNMVDDLEIKNEINILKSLSHPNIVKIYEFFDTVLYYYIVTEYCKKGELFSYIKNKYSEKQLAVLFYQVFSGLCYLHEKKILHRDLKLENLMVSEIEKDIITGEEYFWIKIIDFGTAKIFEKNKTEKAVIGSSYYIAPEVLKQRYNEKCDTWSVGVILYMTLVGVAPFDGRTDEDIIRRIKIGKYNKNDIRFIEHSEEVKDLVYKLLEKKYR